MKPKLISTTLMIALLFVALFSCRKDETLPLPAKTPGEDAGQFPGKSPGNPAPVTPVTFNIKVRAAVLVGTISYDSIPANLAIKLWDSTGAIQERSLRLAAGTNTLELPANTAKIYLKMEQWGTQDEKTVMRETLNEGQIIVLSASKQARRLKEEASFYLINGQELPQSKAEYEYNTDGSIFNVRYHRKEVDKQDLQWHMNARFYYTNGKLTEIKKYDFAPNAQPIITRIDYNGNGKISTMHHNSYGVITTARFEIGTSSVSVYHSYNNGHSLTYHMDLVGGNKVKEEATTSRGGGEGGTFQYDLNINPYAHMNYPDLYLSKISKNNVTSQQKGYSGAIAALEPYKWEYTYDHEGYPVTLLKHFKSGATGEHLRTLKTVFTYGN